MTETAAFVVQGFFLAPAGLESVAKAIEGLAESQVAVHPLVGREGPENFELEIIHPEAAFRSTPQGEHFHQFQGAVQGTFESALAFLKQMSGLMRQSGIEHQLELYDSAGHPAALFPDLGE